ncbi:Protein GLUTAMINE DUMPER 5 [Hibiscus syriacus]|uniref:Protein GLUTAMINE DUMPER 5 n=1 Tax=Hibiscus syriacus TaxID=106335 RepID=A0A6A3CSY0_HIBSY|nr:Protein GLUTAMINE DUMPER 5 [Hibiscus syriacus]
MALTRAIPLRRPSSHAGSHCVCSGRLDNHAEGGDAERDVESGENESESTKPVKIYEEKILVIMAGDEKPTFLATPVCTKASPFGDKYGKPEENEGPEKPANGEKVKEEMGRDDDERLSIITETMKTTRTMTANQPRTKIKPSENVNVDEKKSSSLPKSHLSSRKQSKFNYSSP